MSKNHICSEIQYETNDGMIHSDLCGSDPSNQEWREFLHDCLNEWLDNSNGTGCFYVGNVLEMVSDLLDEKKLLDNFIIDAQLTLTTMSNAKSGGDYDYARTKVRDLIELSEKFMRLEVNDD